MAEAIHSAAPHNLPFFIAGPDATDSLFVFIVCFLIATVLAIGNVYFKLHALPEKIAHSANSAQLQLVGILALLAMFTHNNLFWVAALLLAAFRIPDLTTPLAAISQSIDGLAARLDRPPPATSADAPPMDSKPAPGPSPAPEETSASEAAPGPADAPALPPRPESGKPTDGSER
jgi:hypothetical protein